MKVNEKIIERGRELGYDRVLIVETKVAGQSYTEEIPVFCHNDDYLDKAEEQALSGGKIVANVVLKEPIKGKINQKVDVKTLLVQEELADKIIARLKKWADEDKKQSEKDLRLMKTAKPHNMGQLQQITEAIQTRSNARMGRLELVGDMVRYLELLGFTVE